MIDQPGRNYDGLNSQESKLHDDGISMSTASQYITHCITTFLLTRVIDLHFHTQYYIRVATVSLGTLGVLIVLFVLYPFLMFFSAKLRDLESK